MINMKYVSSIVVVFCVLFAVGSTRCQVVTTFGPFDYFPQIALGPDGAIWFSPGYPTRLMRIAEGTIEEVQIFGIGHFEYEGPCYVAFAPNGEMWLAQNGWSPPPQMIHFYVFDRDTGLIEITMDADLSQEQCKGIFFDSENCLYALNYSWNYRCETRSRSSCRRFLPGVFYYKLWRLSCQAPQVIFSAMYVSRALVFGDRSAWIGGCSVNIYTGELFRRGLFRLDPETGDVLANYTSDDGISDRYSSPRFFDASGRLWIVSGVQVMTFDGDSFDVFKPFAGDELHLDLLAMDANGTVWTSGDQTVSWYNEGQTATYTVGDGLPTGEILNCLIDFDGNLWLQYQGGMLTRISYGGWPPMRLSLRKIETPESIAVVANVFNTQPVVGVDVYIACQIGDSLLFWPNWQPEPSPVQINLYAGFNESVTIIEMPKSQIPPGSYTFWGCMTGRNTQKLIGPIDRKFEMLRIDVNKGG